MNTVDLEFGPAIPVDGSPPHTFEVTVRVPPNLIYFAGHFPTAPVLPAVAVLDRVVLPHASAVWPELMWLKGAPRLKFREPIVPGDMLVLRLSRTGSGRVEYELSRGSKTCSVGVLDFETEP